MRALLLCLTLLAGCTPTIQVGSVPQAPPPKMTYMEACERVRQAESRRDKDAALFREVADIAWRKTPGSPERSHWDLKKQDAGRIVDQRNAEVKQAEAARDAIQ